ncbi:hypothetical protein [Helicobacter pylori]|nr:hypothetical protein [Helicobacter pylori]
MKQALQDNSISPCLVDDYDECEVTDKIKILGNIQKYQMDMLKFRP